jgi:hypothetical protein
MNQKTIIIQHAVTIKFPEGVTDEQAVQMVTENSLPPEVSTADLDRDEQAHVVETTLVDVAVAAEA